MTLTNRTSAKVVAAVALGFAMALAYAMPAYAITQAEATAIITALGLTGSQASVIQALVTTSMPSSSSCNFTVDLTVGSKGADVTCLQTALIAAGYSIPAGATGYFGSQTQAAVSAWQKAVGVTPTAGYFGPKSRAAFSSTVSTTPTTPAAGTGLTVSPGVQPTSSLAPKGATRVPFTTFNLTAGNDGDVVVNSVTVRRIGLGQDAAFNGIILVDADSGQQIGNAKTFNSNHQATIGEPITIARGTTRHFLVAGNMATSLTSYAGQAPAIEIDAVNTASATVSGSLPFAGSYQTLNDTLTVGSITLASSQAFATNANASKEIGTTDYKTTGFRLTAGSAEDLSLKMIRFNQTGSASTVNDLSNIKVSVDGTLYPATVSADGKYVTATLGSGVLIPKGNSVEVYLQYSIIGSNSTNRTVIFDVDKNTDIYAQGVTYGYGVSPAVGSTSVPTTRGTFTVNTSGTPFIYSTQVTITGASITTIGKATEVPAQNVALNVQNQPLGGFVADIKGEGLTVQSMVFNIATGTSATLTGDIASYLPTNITLVDENGAVVAGPVDASSFASGSNMVTFTFTDTVTFKTGRHVYTIRGKLHASTPNGTTLIASTTPAAGWTNVKGETTGNTISLASVTSFTMNTMTVKSAVMTIGPATSPASQTIVPGGQQVLMATFSLDAQQSGEDLRLATIPARLTFATGLSTHLSSCQIYDGATSLTTGSNVVNPSGTSPSDNTFTLDNPLTVAKGSVKAVSVKCNISGNTTNAATYSWAPGAAAFTTSFTVTGANSGSTATLTATSGTAPTFTIGTGSITVSGDATSYTVASAGSLGVPGNIIRFAATNEDATLTKVGLTLTGTASSSANDVTLVHLFDGATEVGTVTFASGATSATSTPLSVNISKNNSKALTVKVDLAAVGTGQQVTSSGHLVKVDYLNAEAVGVSSGSTILLGSAAGSTSVSGIRVFRSFPTVTKGTLPNGTVSDGSRLLRFAVKADDKGPIYITQFKFALSTSTSGTIVSGVNVYGYLNSDYSSSPIGGVSAGGQLAAANRCTAAQPGCATITIPVQDSSGTATVIQVAAGTTVYFEVRAAAITTVVGSQIQTVLSGDSAYPPLTQDGGYTDPESFMTTAGSTTPFSSNGNFIWSPNSTSTSPSVRGDIDWTNGFSIPGMSASGLSQTIGN